MELEYTHTHTTQKRVCPGRTPKNEEGPSVGYVSMNWKRGTTSEEAGWRLLYGKESRESVGKKRTPSGVE